MKFKLLIGLCVCMLLVGCNEIEKSKTEVANVQENKLETKKEGIDKRIRDKESKTKKDDDQEKHEEADLEIKAFENSTSVKEQSNVVSKKDSVNLSNEVPKDEKENQEIKPEEKPIKPQVNAPEIQEPVIEVSIKQDAMAQSVMTQINVYRQQHGLQPLTQSSYHQQKADSHAYAMAEARALWHQDNGECITNSPYPFSAWVSSPEHNEILLRENNTQGVVSIYFVDGYYYSVFKTSW